MQEDCLKVSNCTGWSWVQDQTESHHFSFGCLLRWLDGIQLAAVGGQLDHHVEKENLRDSGGSDLMVLRLNSTGNVCVTSISLVVTFYPSQYFMAFFQAFCWRSSDPTWHRLLWDMRKPVCIKEIFLSVSLMAFVTSDGEAFTSSLSQFKARSPPKSKGWLSQLSA